MVLGKDPRTYPATLEPGKPHALAVAALRRQPCLSCARTDYAEKYAVNIRSILTLPNSYLFQLTDLFFFLGRCLLCILSLFRLSSTSTCRESLQTGTCTWMPFPILRRPRRRAQFLSSMQQRFQPVHPSLTQGAAGNFNIRGRLPSTYNTCAHN